MKNILSKYILGTIMLATVGLSSCDDAKYDDISNKAFIAETSLSTYKSVKLPVDDFNGNVLTATPRINQPIDRVATYTVELSESALNEFNKKNNMDYKMLPAEFIDFNSTEVEIASGDVLGATQSINIKPLSTDLMSDGNKYAIAVEMKSLDGTVEVLKGANLLVGILEFPIVTSVPTINSRNNVAFTMRQDYELMGWSVEFLINIDRLGTGVGQLNNQAIFAAFASDGKDGEIYSRFGDAPIKGNVFQVKNQGTQINSATEFEPNKWYHIAMVNDGSKLILYVNGKEDISIASPNKMTQLDRNKFQLGNTDYLKANFMMSELRFWTKAITADQVKNNMYSVDPNADGLEAYWKLNEGEGNEFQDATGHGNIGKSKGTTNWTDGVKFGGAQ